jgi:hypothetical protein
MGERRQPAATMDSIYRTHQDQEGHPFDAADGRILQP